MSLAKCLWLTVVLFCAAGLPAVAQLQAAFTVDKVGGCAPLSVRFTNTTSGASGAATFTWQLGNGNTSSLRNPGATYLDAKTYTIALTVTDGAATSTSSKDVTVYKNPEVDFSLTPNSGCMPLSINFTANATPGDGSISKYYWDFGDGDVSEGSNLSTVAHTYTFAQKPPVSLTVTNSFGCFSTRLKNNLIDVYQSVTADFDAAETTLCAAGESATFRNNSTGRGTLTYLWDFGDGTTGTAKDPTHVYAKTGIYTVKLTTTSAEGCSATVQKNSYINVADFGIGIVRTDTGAVCQGTNITLQAKHNTPPNSITWTIDGSYVYNYGNNIMNYTYSKVGTNAVVVDYTFGKCKVSASTTINVKASPQMGEVITTKTACGAPLDIGFKDTTSTAVKWEWSSSSHNFSTANRNLQAFTERITTGSYLYYNLKVTNAEGCSSQRQYFVQYEKPNFHVRVIAGGSGECAGTKIKVGPGHNSYDARDSLKSVVWDFGDGTKSTSWEPEHSYSTGGEKLITMTYVANSGCIGTATFSPRFVDKPKFDFTALPGTTVCGNSFVTFKQNLNEPWIHTWYDANWKPLTSNYTLRDLRESYQFQEDSTYTIHMVSCYQSCADVCRDTVTKVNFITVLPPFSKITDVVKTCEGNRDVVKFVDGSRKGTAWKWTFGDGTATSFATKPDTVAHRYAKSGQYRVFQEVTNGSCTLKDSVLVNVITKQKPLLSSSITELCSTGEIPIKINNLDTPWGRYSSSVSYGYDIKALEFNGNRPSNANDPFIAGSRYWINVLDGKILYPYVGKDSFRIILEVDCLDTTNYIPVKVYGPQAGYFVTQPSPCIDKPIRFNDSSKINFGKKIVQWEWIMENNTPLVKTNGNSFNYAFATPGSYRPWLKVTDEKGCTDQIYGYYPAIEVSGPKVDFTPSRTIVPPNSLVNFSNTSNEGPFYWYTTQYKWIYPDGSTAIDRNGSFNFTTEGVFSVKLIGTNSYTGCSDTIVKTITVRKVNSAFTYTTTYTNTNGCPPAMVRFTSTATNVSSYGWSFGDGSIAGNQKIANHTYNEAGVYRVVHYAYDANGGVDSTEDYIEIKGPYALLKTNDFFACNSFEVRLAAEVKNASKFTWDFGDGTLVEGKDTTATHRYATPGIYTPALILEDATGCKTTSLMPEKIVVDSLQADFSISPARVCLGTPIFFGGIYNSYAQSRLQQPLQQRWTVSSPANTILASDTLANINYRFLSPGLHTVTLAVSSLYGCRDTVVKTINVQPAINAAIVAIPAICQGDSLGFATTVAPNAGSLSWRWTIPGQPSFTTASTSKLAWPTAGTFNISAVADNGLCADSATATLTVHAKPNLQLTAVDKHLCLGDSLLLNATGAPTVQWRSHPTQLPQSGNAIKVFPKVDTWYLANGISSQGCQTADSVMVKVAQPIAISPKTSTVETCQNVPVNLGVGGAPNYEWLPTTGLSNSRIANPVANPPSNTTYTVVGFDGVGCFTDTATVRVLVNAVPKVDVGPNLSVLSGSTVTLNATASLTVATWLWQPATYLSCTNCASPIAAPKTDMVYTAKATTAKGCAASDTLSIKILCDESRIYLPTGFTPNGDNLNDRFGVLGGGIKTIRSFVVMDRWGKVVFERKMANPTDRNSSWDGSRNGEPAPLGAYVYMLEVECDGGQVFSYKGTVMLVR